MKLTFAVAALAGVAAAAPQLANREVAAVAAVQNQAAAQAADQKAGLAKSKPESSVKAAPHNVGTGIGIGLGVTKKDVQAGVCRPVTFIFARGTTEAGNIGSRGFAGVGLMNNLVSHYGANGIALQGVNYDAANFFSNFELGDRGGVNDMEYEIEKAVSQCKTTKLVLGGYSQGAMLTHRSVGHLSQSALSRIAAIIMFGDPFHQGTAGIGKFPASIPSSRIKTYCHTGDGVCLGTALILPAHLTYTEDTKSAATWVEEQVSSFSGGDDSDSGSASATSDPSSDDESAEASASGDSESSASTASDSDASESESSDSSMSDSMDGM